MAQTKPTETELTRLARIMFARTHDESWEQAEQITRETYLGDVRAVLEALREPTEEMRKHQYHGPVISWTATIDAILNEEGTE